MNLKIDTEKLFMFVPPICPLCMRFIWAGEVVVKQKGAHQDYVRRQFIKEAI